MSCAQRREEAVHLILGDRVQIRDAGIVADLLSLRHVFLKRYWVSADSWSIIDSLLRKWMTSSCRTGRSRSPNCIVQALWTASWSLESFAEWNSWSAHKFRFFKDIKSQKLNIEQAKMQMRKIYNSNLGINKYNLLMYLLFFCCCTLAHCKTLSSTARIKNSK